MNLHSVRTFNEGGQKRLEALLEDNPEFRK